MSYSQNNEQEIITKHFAGETGRFLDIGAYDGRTFSNTLALAEAGWSGVCVEASPTVFPALLAIHGGNPRIELFHGAVDPGQSRMTLWYDCGGDAVSTTEPDHVRKWEAGSKLKFKPFTIQTVSILNLLAHFGLGFNFVNIDVEGGNWPLFAAMPWDSMPAVKVICVEHDFHADKMTRALAPLGFKLAGLNAENVLFYR